MPCDTKHLQCQPIFRTEAHFYLPQTDCAQGLRTAIETGNAKGERHCRVMKQPRTIIKSREVSIYQLQEIDSTFLGYMFFLS